MLDYDLLKAQNRHAELARTAAMRRLAKRAGVERPRRASFRSRLLDRLGRSLVAWGWWLRARYGNLETADIRRAEA
jgi:hypothetical protein